MTEPRSVDRSPLPAHGGADLDDQALIWSGVGRDGAASGGSSHLRIAGLILGPGLFLVLLILPIPDLSTSARGIVGLAVWMAMWWFSEAIPLAATSLLLLVVYPLLGRAELRGG